MVSVTEVKNLVRCVPLYYITYNRKYVVLCVLIILCFLTFISIAAVAMRYELFNKQAICDPTFYYGKACRDTISRNMTQDPDFIKYKQRFYGNIDKLIDPMINKDEKDIGTLELNINKGDSLVSDEFIDASTKKISKITDILTRIKTQSLGNLGSGLIKPVNDINNAISEKLKDLPNVLNDIKIKLHNGFIKPSTIHLYDALDKLYKSTLEGGKPAPTESSNLFTPPPTFSPNIPISR